MRSKVVWAFVLIAALAVAGNFVGGDQSTLARELTKRFGNTSTKRITKGDSWRLELTLTGRRWRGLNADAVDSAQVVARYALAQMGPEQQRPDTIMVGIRTLDRGMVPYRATETVRAAFAVEEL